MNSYFTIIIVQTNAEINFHDAKIVFSISLLHELIETSVPVQTDTHEHNTPITETYVNIGGALTSLEFRESETNWNNMDACNDQPL